MGTVRTIELKQNQILLDSSFLEAGKVKKLCGKRRFTLAHECAHQILFQMESEESQQKCRESYSERRSYSLRDLKSREDWNEWQANALGAALLMPQAEIKRAMWLFAQCRTLISYEGRFSYGRDFHEAAGEELARKLDSYPIWHISSLHFEWDQLQGICRPDGC